MLHVTIQAEPRSGLGQNELLGLQRYAATNECAVRAADPQILIPKGLCAVATGSVRIHTGYSYQNFLLAVTGKADIALVVLTVTPRSVTNQCILKGQPFGRV